METEEILAAIQKAANTIATPNWAAVLSAFAAILAVVVAGVVAWKQFGIAKKQNEIAKEQTEISKKQAEISEQQNKIALFEKQFLIFVEISKVTKFGLAIDTVPKINAKHALDYERVNLGYDFVVDIENPQNTRINTIAINRTLAILKQAEFLFPVIEKDDVTTLCDTFYDFFNKLVDKVLENPDMTIEQFESADKNNFIDISKKFQQEYIPKIVQTLYLTR